MVQIVLLARLEVKPGKVAAVTALLTGALALANALAYRLLWRRRLARWDVDPPLGGRLMAIGSLALWLAVAGLGRWIAYA